MLRRGMIESELKILLDDAGMRALSAHPRLDAFRLGPPRTETLVSIYQDTVDDRLRSAGIALRLRKIGRRWVQTVKRKGAAGEGGFFANAEDERPAPGGRLVLEGDDPDGALAAVRAAIGDATLVPVFETRVQRTSQRLGIDGLGEVELALDVGEVRAGERTEPIREAEFELKAGGVGAIFAVARQVLDRAPFRLGTTNKAARGYRLLRDGAAPASAPRKAGSFDFGPDTGVEIVARDVLRDCLAQISANLPVVLECDASEGPHQLRIGLRRLRTALQVFAPELGDAGIEPIETAAARLGRDVGHLRDADVLIDEVVAHAAAHGLDPEARRVLDAALASRRETIRAEVRTVLAAPETGRFLLDLLEYIETRGWLDRADYGQTARLAQPVGELGPRLLRKRWRKAKSLGEDIRELEPEELHSLRKSLKKLRYTVDMLISLYPGKRSAAFLAALKDLQDSFGSLNDAAMADAKLGTDPVAPEDPMVQRAVGFTLGILAGASAAERPQVFARWDALADTKPFWT
ncbi:MAG: CHAD domain-containing protein [Amaricoccus sp.]|uniref:CYTH and CHAD domain-containing protein n=1 Tax=Amaricoccus sp. TaxID=1872485 RepID=UPI0039E2AD4C